jgi:hypothetical protein
MLPERIKKRNFGIVGKVSLMYRLFTPPFYHFSSTDHELFE